jgi:hypothetical protein
LIVISSSLVSAWPWSHKEDNVPFDQTKFDLFVEDAEHSLATGNITQATDSLKEATALNPTGRNLQRLDDDRGNLAEKNGNDQDALKFYEEGAAADSSDWRISYVVQRDKCQLMKKFGQTDKECDIFLRNEKESQDELAKLH